MGRLVRRLPIPEVIAGYVPRLIPSDVWREIEDEVREIVRDSAPSTSSIADHHMLAVGRFLAWAYEQGRSRSPEALFTPDNVEYYVANYCGHLSPASRGTRRSVLRTVGRQITRRAPWDPPTPTYPTSATHSPYTADQCQWLLECVAHQSTPFRKRVMRSALGLGLGAGLAPAELAVVTTTQIIDVADGSISVALPDRVVPVRSSYAHLLRTLRDALPVDVTVLRDTPIRRVEDMSNMVGALDIPASLRPMTVSRMRLTWAFDALCAPIPLPTVMAAYGARSLNFTDRLVSHLLHRADTPTATSSLHQF